MTTLIKVLYWVVGIAIGLYLASLASMGIYSLFGTPSSMAAESRNFLTAGLVFIAIIGSIITVMGLTWEEHISWR